MHAFARLHDLGHAHSFEVWNAEGELAGGGYGLALGDVFFTESQFSKESDTSKLGFTVFNYHLAKWGFALNDGKALTPTTRDQGFREIPRAEFRALLDRHGSMPSRVGRWTADGTVKEVAEWQPGRTRAQAAE
jgi:leucyl/phenylalanyl-tRNA--protein transferase